MPQCKSCRCIKGLDDYTTGLRLFKTCFSCRHYQKTHRPPPDKARQKVYSRECYLRKLATNSL